MQEEAKTPGYNRRWLGLAFICVSLTVIALDNTVLNVALPSIARDLSASASELQWVIDAYVLVFAALLLTTGSTGDRIGRKKALQIGLVLFGIGSLGAALSTSTLMLIAFRAFCGLAGAMIMPATLSLITTMFPGRERAQAIAIWAGVYGLGIGVGPVIGGWLVEHYHWSSVFYVNLPVIVIALIGGALFLTESRDEDAPRPDVPGVFLSIGGLFALIYGIIEAGNYGWTDTSVIVAFVAAVILLTALAVWEWRTPNAMLPVHFFRNMSFTGANVALVFLAFSLFGSVFFLTQYLQTIHGFTPFEAGVYLLPSALVMALMATLSARVAAHIGTKYTTALGIFASGVGLFIMARVLDANTPVLLVVFCTVILTFGIGMAFSPATNSVMGSVPVRKAGVGSAMNDTTRQLGGALGVAVLGTIMNSSYLAGIASLRSMLSADLFGMVASSVQGAHLAASDPKVPAAVAQQIVTTSNAAFMIGMNDALTIGAVIMAVATVLVLVILPLHVIRSQDDDAPVGERAALASSASD